MRRHVDSDFDRPRAHGLPRTALMVFCVLFACTGILACSGPKEAERVRLPVVLDRSGVETVTTNLGYVVTLSEARMVLDDLAFATAGEAHTASAFERLWGHIIPTAWAHPGHFQGGDITGELPGRFFLDWLANADSVTKGQGLYEHECARCHGEFASGGRTPSGTAPSIAGYSSIASIVRQGKGEMPAFDFTPSELSSLQSYLSQRLGEARLLVGDYHSVNFTLGKATAADELANADALLSHTAVLRGRAVKSERAIDFTVLITSPSDRQITGVPFGSTITGNSHTSLRLRFNTKDALEGDTLFDDIDFTALDRDGDGHVMLSEAGKLELEGVHDASVRRVDAATSPSPDAGPVDGGAGGSPDNAPNSSELAAGTEALEAAYHRLRRAFQTHDHFEVKAKASK